MQLFLVKFLYLFIFFNNFAEWCVLYACKGAQMRLNENADKFEAYRTRIGAY